MMGRIFPMDEAEPLPQLKTPRSRPPEEQQKNDEKVRRLERKLTAPILGGEVAWKEISRLQRLLLRTELKSPGPFEYSDPVTGVLYSCRRQPDGIVEIRAEDQQKEYVTTVSVLFDTNTGTIKEAWKTLRTKEPVEQTDSLHPTLTEVHALIYRLEIGSGVDKPKQFAL